MKQQKKKLKKDGKPQVVPEDDPEKVIRQLLKCLYIEMKNQLSTVLTFDRS